MTLASARFREAKETLAKAFQELEEGMEKKDSLRVRGSCEKGWFSAIAAADSLLVGHRYDEAKTHIDRRRKFRELALRSTAWLSWAYMTGSRLEGAHSLTTGSTTRS